MSEHFSLWVRERLKQRRWSQRELGRQMETSQSYISDILTGKINPSVEFLLKLAETLGEAPEEVFRQAEILPSPQEEEAGEIVSLVAILRQLETEGRQQLLDYARFLLNKQRGIL